MQAACSLRRCCGCFAIASDEFRTSAGPVAVLVRYVLCDHRSSLGNEVLLMCGSSLAVEEACVHFLVWAVGCVLTSMAVNYIGALCVCHCLYRSQPFQAVVPLSVSRWSGLHTRETCAGVCGVARLNPPMYCS